MEKVFEGLYLISVLDIEYVRDYEMTYRIGLSGGAVVVRRDLMGGL